MEQNEKTEKIVPLGFVIQNARTIVNGAVNTLQKELGIPYYLIDGILSEILSDIRRKELAELSGQSLEEKRGE